MNEALNSFIDSLREELKQYGEMLALLDHQQELVVSHHGADLMQSVFAIDAQTRAVHAARNVREERCRSLAAELKLDEPTALKELAGRLPAHYRPLVEALVQENQELLVRVRQRARQNHLLLSRTVELMERLINSFASATTPATYTATGLTPARVQPAAAFYENLG
jgi:flagellar biosynthesis/type III secretory pathway chaperone